MFFIKIANNMPSIYQDSFLLLLQCVKLKNNLLGLPVSKQIQGYCDINYIIPQNNTPDIHSKLLKY